MEPIDTTSPPTESHAGLLRFSVGGEPEALSGYFCPKSFRAPLPEGVAAAGVSPYLYAYLISVAVTEWTLTLTEPTDRETVAQFSIELLEATIEAMNRAVAAAAGGMDCQGALLLIYDPVRIVLSLN
jgi:hypothetical protein